MSGKGGQEGGYLDDVEGSQACYLLIMLDRIMDWMTLVFYATVFSESEGGKWYI